MTRHRLSNESRMVALLKHMTKEERLRALVAVARLWRVYNERAWGGKHWYWRKKKRKKPK